MSTRAALGVRGGTLGPWLGAILGSLLALNPGAALASSASVSDSTLDYSASVGETNDVNVSLVSDVYTITDQGPPITSGAGCTAVGPNQVACASAGIALVVVNVGDLDDLVTVSAPTPSSLDGGAGNDVLNGGAGDDFLSGGPGTDVLNGGPGNDLIDSNDGEADKVACGDGFDSVIADSQDTVAGDCEAVKVVANSPPDCSTVSAHPNRLWPPNHKLRLVTLSGATDPDGDPVTLTVTTVTQDEPVSGLGDDDLSPDAQAGTQSDNVFLRAERSGTGDGRVYRVSFTGSDGEGGSCSDTATAGVPKNMRPGSTAVDSAPPSYDSFGP